MKQLYHTKLPDERGYLPRKKFTFDNSLTDEDGEYCEFRGIQPRVYVGDIEAFITNALNQQRELIKRKNFEFMEECEPDCDEVRHARHQGSWEHFWKMDEFLTKLEK